MTTEKFFKGSIGLHDIKLICGAAVYISAVQLLHTRQSASVFELRANDLVE